MRIYSLVYFEMDYMSDYLVLHCLIYSSDCKTVCSLRVNPLNGIYFCHDELCPNLRWQVFILGTVFCLFGPECFG